jgi:hypothetical protein
LLLDAGMLDFQAFAEGSPAEAGPGVNLAIVLLETVRARYGPAMTADAAVRGQGFHLTLRVGRYERPEDATGGDANWLVGAVEPSVGTTGAFTAKHQLSLFTSDLERFRDELRALDRELSGEATFHHIGSQVGLTIKLANGSGTLSGFVREHIGVGA